MHRETCEPLRFRAATEQPISKRCRGAEQALAKGMMRAEPLSGIRQTERRRSLLSPPPLAPLMPRRSITA
jgi:hypothetical protein